MKRREEGSECGGCGRDDMWVLHKIKHKTNFLRLCTDCLLNHHLGVFCPLCFHVYEQEEEEKVMCLKCPSVSHLSCLPPHSDSFICPSCSSPGFLFSHSARALVTAAQISAISMTQAAALARLEADKRVKEAAFAKKRATQALNTLASFSSRSNQLH